MILMDVWARRLLYTGSCKKMKREEEDGKGRIMAKRK
jgi:hypothetical protein